ncbi:hypothetical protein [Flavobacterium johnsoniae]|uniref:Uncharacterized protein n=1 Tax=Flavobacterium johnsoniae TaxID=986 RepID=A0A1J7CGC0_FLAJO|nr:hypothetical protein [Flavobacterium johnsoniae]OIV40600.1 hypothetical protein BKM63_17180 [Flavobacterium johnsoniae]
MDFFKNVTIEDFNTRFLIELNSVTEFTQYNDPNDFFEPEQEYGNHIMRCQENELNFIRNTIKANLTAHRITITAEEFKQIVQSKREQIIASRPRAIDQFIERITVTYIDPEQSEREHKFFLHRYLHKFWKSMQSIINH